MSLKCSISFKTCFPARAHAVGIFVLAVCVGLFSLLSFASAPRAQFARRGELPSIDAKARAAIVDSLTAAIDSIYVLDEPAKRIVAGLR